jgi:hypothetical protein
VTEAEWLACTDPRPMLEFLGDQAWDRKRRLFALACCRRIWHVIPHECARREQSPEPFYKALEAVERDADDRETKGEAGKHSLPAGSFALNAFGAACEPETSLVLWDQPLRTVSTWASAAVAPDTETVLVPWWVGRFPTGPAGPAQLAEQAAHCRLLRDIFGNPFRPAALSPAWRAPTVVALAQAAYDNRTLPAGALDTARLTVLADALEEAGCNNADIGSHLRGPGPHVRGCWVVDLVLGKQ